jgi:hypothetical protein
LRRGELLDVPRAAGIYAVLRQEQRHILRYEVARQRLSVPVRAQLPVLHARAAVLCSGMLPAFDRTAPDHPSLVYAAVPYHVALAIARSLDQEVILTAVGPDASQEPAAGPAASATPQAGAAPRLRSASAQPDLDRPERVLSTLQVDACTRCLRSEWSLVWAKRNDALVKCRHCGMLVIVARNVWRPEPEARGSDQGVPQRTSHRRPTRGSNSR